MGATGIDVLKDRSPAVILQLWLHLLQSHRRSLFFMSIL